MTKLKELHIVLFFLLCSLAGAQEVASLFDDAFELAYEGRHSPAKQKIEALLTEDSNHIKARILLARTLSWQGNYKKARNEFNKVLSIEKNNSELWIAAIKNELYADANYIALGLAYKAQNYIKDNKELVRLTAMAYQRVENHKYRKWQEDLVVKKGSKKTEKPTTSKLSQTSQENKTTEPLNRIGVDNMVTVFDQRYDPWFFSSVSYRRRTKMGTILPRINFSNRLGTTGVQYDIDLYPKFLKRFYAYLNYGYSNSNIYPRQKMGGDIYVNLPGAIEFSAGGRYIKTNNQDIKAITNSLGYYRGNYYFSLRSFITPRSDKLTRVSGNLLVRKYLKDAENFIGFNVGMGVSPELRQFFSADETLLAETILFIESQRLNLEYQFTGNSNKNVYRARIGVRRQELSFDSGSFFWGVSAGITYNVQF